jgi:Tfp pilus assembly protein PilN
MRAVNLLPDPKKDARERRRPPNVVALGGVVGAVALTALMAMWFLAVSGTVTERQNEIDNLEAELQATPLPAPKSTDGDALEQEKVARIAAVGAALGARVAWDRVLRELSLVTPDDVWLTSLTASAPTASTAGAAAAATPGGGFSINGRTYSHDSVARLLARLSLVPDLQSVKLEKSLLVKAAGRDVVEFTIAASVRGRAAS